MKSHQKAAKAACGSRVGLERAQREPLAAEQPLEREGEDGEEGEQGGQRKLAAGPAGAGPFDRPEAAEAGQKADELVSVPKAGAERCPGQSDC
jgi:hypothetical protein